MLNFNNKSMLKELWELNASVGPWMPAIWDLNDPGDAMSEQFIGQIDLFSFGFAPKGWAPCNGQLLAINQNQALFSLLGTTYGGNGTTTFALPNLQGQVAVSQGQGPGLQNYNMGQQGGIESVTLTSAQMPSHSHSLAGDDEKGSAVIPKTGYFAMPNNDPAVLTLYGPANNLVPLNPGSVTGAGGNQPHTNLQPCLALNYCIALTGIFPSRN